MRSAYRMFNWKGAVMIGTFHPLLKRVAFAAALAVGAAGAARADDSSMNPFTGESYAGFNGGANLPAVTNPSFNTAPSEWRQANPNGLPERVFQSYSAPGENWHMTHPATANAATDPSFEETHPNGLTERELQALSSGAPVWQLPGEPGTAMASENQAPVAQAPQQGQRFANLFHRTPTSATQ
jgi:hypothetical protein